VTFAKREVASFSLGLSTIAENSSEGSIWVSGSMRSFSIEN